MSQRDVLPLTQAGASRDDAYKLVQRNALRVWNENKDFYSELISDKDVRSFLTEEDIKDKFDLSYHTKHVNTIFKRVFFF